jgi:hypothetical protein
MHAPVSATAILAEIAEDADSPHETTISLLAISMSHLEERSGLQLDLPLGLDDEKRRPGTKKGIARWKADRAIDVIRDRSKQPRRQPCSASERGAAISRRTGGMLSGCPRASVNDRPDVLATQRCGESAWDEPVYDLHTLEVASNRHDLEKRTVYRERALELRKISDVRLAQKLRLLSAGSLGVRRSLRCRQTPRAGQRPLREQSLELCRRVGHGSIPSSISMQIYVRRIWKEVQAEQDRRVALR